jgi:SAM-dependent methyltransferase
MTEDWIQELHRYADAARQLKGWELEFEPEPLAPGPPWDYEALVRELASRARTVVDLGTGGGEVLSRVLPPSGCRAFATEWWSVNAPIASQRLADRAHVVRASSLQLPFPPASFDLVLSRHEEINPEEVVRVLAPGGRLLTQQVIPDYWPELRSVFPDMTRFPDHFSEYPRQFIQAGLVVEGTRQYRRPVRFRELGHLVYHLVACPWTVPNFSVESRREALARLDRQVRSKQGLVLTEGFTLLQVRADA